MLTEIPSNATYTSPEIHNELISIAAQQIRQNMCHEANTAGIIAVIVDETKDVSQREQLSLCICYTSLPDYD